MLRCEGRPGKSALAGISIDQIVVLGPRNLRTFKETECGSFRASAAAVEFVRWCAMAISYLHFQSIKN